MAEACCNEFAIISLRELSGGNLQIFLLGLKHQPESHTDAQLFHRCQIASFYVVIHNYKRQSEDKLLHVSGAINGGHACCLQ